MGLKVAIVGLAESTHDEAPWDDPSWEKWGLPWDTGYWRRLDRGFEMHDMRLLNSRFSKRPADYFDRLAEIPVVYMQEAYLPGIRRYPFEEVAQTTGDYWNSSAAYMLALAIHEGAEEIGIWGVDLAASDEYGYQKPNMEYLVGMARGRGIKVHIPEASSLCKFKGDGITFFDHVPTYKLRYGWLG